ncbi:MAG: glycogen debranching protein GlgX [Nitrospirae bacterium]|nr:glycogen debranching protein GlgX [Nitrospirota bacterium]MBF0592227.1 glycogen debranching protein GlgX [Nitrospirota bacterium]
MLYLKRVGNLEIFRGNPLPMGATVRGGGVNFAIFSKHATAVTLVIFAPGERELVAEIALHPCFNKTGDIWHVFVKGVGVQTRYGYRMERQTEDMYPIHCYNPDTVLLDPYATALTGASTWGKIDRRRGDDQEQRFVNIRRSLVIEDDYDWGYDKPLENPLRDSIIYEVHVRGFTAHPSSKVQTPGTYAGIVEKIPYLKELGVTAIELLPIAEFEEMDSDRIDPSTGQRLTNFWGYQPISFFAPKASYASDSKNGGQLREFKDMVRKLHEANIEVILDVVFNHTAEGNELGPAFSFKGIDNSTYYIIDPIDGHYHNYSGCGNTLNCNHPVVRTMIIDCLRFWVMDMHVDGFRFDLASILGRGRTGAVLNDPPLLERIAADPILANTKLIAEAWDAAGLYQVGTFPNWGRWAEWNGKFRDDIRRFVRGEGGMVKTLTTRLMGSPELYKESNRAPYHSINFVTSHDGFTLNDLVSYNTKHNANNGENNRDGTDDNLSWNCGWEGHAKSKDISRLRRQQMKNFAALLFVSQGVPMLLAGDEIARTQNGNNNAYCQDNELSWFNWELTKTNEDIFRFFKLMIRFRKQHKLLRPESFLDEDATSVSWHGVKIGKPDMSHDSRSIAMLLCGEGQESDIYLIANAYWEELNFALPKPFTHRRWFRSVDTAQEHPFDITEIGNEVFMNEQSHYMVWPRSVVILVSK